MRPECKNLQMDIKKEGYGENRGKVKNKSVFIGIFLLAKTF